MMRSLSVTAARIDRFDRRRQPLFKTVAQLLDVAVCRGPATAPRRTAAPGRKPVPLQPILVVHRGLMHQIRERAFAFGAAAAEENQLARRAGWQSTTQSGVTFTSSQSPAGVAGSASTVLMTLNVEMIDHAGMGAACFAHARSYSSITVSRRASDDDELLPVGSRAGRRHS